MKLPETDSQLNDKSIIEDLKSSFIARRRKAENQVFHRFSYFIQEATKKYGLTEDAVFDAYSDTVMAGISAICSGGFREHCSLKTFLFQIFHFKCVDIVRRRLTRKNSVHQTIGIESVNVHMYDSSYSGLDKLITKSDGAVLRAHLKKLCNKSQRLLLLSVEGYSDKEIAKVMNFKTGRVVKTSRLRCIQKLRELNSFQYAKATG